MKIKLVLIFFLILTSIFSRAESIPLWVKASKPSDSQYKYYVGRSSPLSSEEAAYLAADKNAREIAIRENFGSVMQIDSTTIDTIENSQSLTRIQEKSRVVNLYGFETEDSYLLESKDEKGNKTYVRWILYRYLRSAIESEKKRLQSTLGTRDTEFNSSGENGNCNNDNNSTLEITSNENPSRVIIDGEAYGLTPLKIVCQLLVNKELLIRVDNPGFKTHVERIVLIQGQKKQINVTLIPATNLVYVVTEPPGARFSINGSFKGVTPISIEVQTGSTLQFMFTHPEASKYMQEVFIGKDEPPLEKTFILPLKSSYLSISSNPLGAEVFLDSEPVGVSGITPTGFISCPIGHHTVTVVKEGYSEYKEDIVCNPGQRYVIDAKLDVWYGPTNLFAVSWGSLGQNYEDVDLNPLGFSFEYTKRFFKQFGAAANFQGTFSEKEYPDLKISSRGYRFLIGAPVFFLANYRSKRWLEFRPEISIHGQIFELEDSRGATTVLYKRVQTSVGISTAWFYKSNFIRIAYNFNDDAGGIKSKDSVSIFLGSSESW